MSIRGVRESHAPVADGFDVERIRTIMRRSPVTRVTAAPCSVVQRFDVPGTVRTSLALYNTRGEVDALAAALREAQEIVG